MSRKDECIAKFQHRCPCFHCKRAVETTITDQRPWIIDCRWRRINWWLYPIVCAEQEFRLTGREYNKLHGLKISLGKTVASINRACRKLGKEELIKIEKRDDGVYYSLARPKYAEWIMEWIEREKVKGIS
jgi:hypothetical protein